MMLRLPVRLFLAALLLVLLCGAGCTGSGNPAPTAQDGSVTPTAGTTGTVEGTETLDYSDGDFEVLAVGPELTRCEERGLMIFRHYCAHCHGASGAGDGQNSYGLETPPRDLLDIEMDALSDEHLQQVITMGGAASGLSPLMPPWGHTLEPHRIADLVMMIRILPDLEGMDEEADIPSLDDEEGLDEDDMGDFSL
jgi:hypothetical protein